MLNYPAIKIRKVDPTRYHLFYKKSKDTVVASAREWNIKQRLAECSKFDICIEERCMLCWTYGLAKMPNIQKGEILAFTHDEVLEDIVLVKEEFDPYDEDLKTLDDLLRLGYVQRIQYLELWKE